jgi:hypothetical protein
MKKFGQCSHDWSKPETDTDIYGNETLSHFCIDCGLNVELEQWCTVCGDEKCICVAAQLKDHFPAINGAFSAVKPFIENTFDVIDKHRLADFLITNADTALLEKMKQDIVYTLNKNANTAFVEEMKNMEQK